MFAQLGDIVFDPLSGFNSVSDTDDAAIVQYPLLQGKPSPVFMAPQLRTLSIGVRLHQAFIVVKQARVQLRAHKDNGDVLALSWGNGDVEGNFLIESIATEWEAMDGQGNVFSAVLTIGLLEVPDDFLLNSKQASSFKAAFAGNPAAYPPVVFVRPVPYVKPPWEVFAGYAKLALKLAGMIESLSYGGKFPNLGRSLGAIMGNLDANLGLMGDIFGSDWSADLWGIGDISGDITAARGYLHVLQGIDPILDSVGFRAKNKLLQGSINFLCF